MSPANCKVITYCLPLSNCSGGHIRASKGEVRLSAVSQCSIFMCTHMIAVWVSPHGHAVSRLVQFLHWVCSFVCLRNIAQKPPLTAFDKNGLRMVVYFAQVCASVRCFVFLVSNTCLLVAEYHPVGKVLGNTLVLRPYIYCVWKSLSNEMSGHGMQ